MKATLLLLAILGAPARAAQPEGLSAAAAAAWRADPVAAELAWTGGPERTRTGQAAFVGDAFRDPAVGPVVLERLLRAGDPADWRPGLALAAVRAEAVPADGLPDLLRAEPDPAVRVVLLEATDRAPTALAAAPLALGATDRDPAVRAAALRALAGRDDVTGLDGLVVAGAQDRDAEVRAAAAQAIGWRGLAALWPVAEALLGDGDPAVRIKALRALERLDAGRARGLPAALALCEDPDPRTAAVARRLRDGR
ncbi:hypothetical protein L6R53_14880 [Myxococcota bacterium]|nr:hypothetical protein [Myxococcota bacterium]